MGVQFFDDYNKKILEAGVCDQQGQKSEFSLKKDEKLIGIKANQGDTFNTRQFDL